MEDGIMASRMDRYYQNEKVEHLRTKKNENLYQEIYEDTESYSNIEGITSISRTGKVDMDDIKKLLNNRTDNRMERNKKIEMQESEKVSVEEKKEESSERVYDIRDILNKAKSQTNIDNKYHRLKYQDYDFLKNVDIHKEEEDVDKELDKLVNTLTNADLLSEIDDDELSLDLLSELKPSGETKVSENLKKLIQEEAKNYHKPENKLDQTFFTSDLHFKKEDFVDEDDEFYDKKSKKWLYTILIILFIIGIIIGAYFLLK